MNEKLSTYLSFLVKQKEAGLVIVYDPNIIEQVKNQIAQHNFVLTNSWQEILENFRNKKSICLTLGENISKELYDLIAQYSAREGSIQIMNKESMKLESVQSNPIICHLLILTSKQAIDEIEKNHSIKDKVGLIERL